MMEIKFHVKDGLIHFFHCEQAYDSDDGHGEFVYRTYSAEGIIPEHIASEGEEAVALWAERYVVSVISEQKERDRKLHEQYRAVNIPITVYHDGRQLSGRITTKDGSLVVVLDTPSVGEAGFSHGGRFGAVVVGRHVWRVTNASFTQTALDEAKGILIELFERYVHRHLYVIVDELNARMQCKS